MGGTDPNPMSAHPPQCPFCRERMERGFMLDGQHGTLTNAKWIAGEPEKSFWTGVKVKGKKQVPIQAFRCPRCGFLANYANDP